MSEETNNKQELIQQVGKIIKALSKDSDGTDPRLLRLIAGHMNMTAALMEELDEGDKKLPKP